MSVQVQTQPVPHEKGNIILPGPEERHRPKRLWNLLPGDLQKSPGEVTLIPISGWEQTDSDGPSMQPNPCLLLWHWALHAVSIARWLTQGPSAVWCSSHWFILVVCFPKVWVAFFFSDRNHSRVHSPATTAFRSCGCKELQRSQGHVLCFALSQIILHLPDCCCALCRSQACRAGRGILGNDLHLNTCVSFLSKDINEDICICSTAADFARENSDHVFVDCKERGRNPDKLITK